MLTDEAIAAGAAAFARTLQVAGGRTSFDFAVRAHLPWFAAMLARGLGWNGIVRVLSAAGVARDDGRPLSRGHISAVYWRQVHATGSVAGDHPPKDATPCKPRKLGLPAPTRQNAAAGPSQASPPQTSTLQVSSSAATAEGVAASRPSGSTSVAGPLQSDVRGYMRRAVALQRSGDDDL